MNVGAFVQSSGTGTTDFGNLSLTASGEVSVSTKNISGTVTGDAITLLATESISATISAGSLILWSNSAVLNGTIGGTDGNEAVLKIVFNGDVGSGPYKFNGLAIFPGEFVASNGQTISLTFASQANSQSATVASADGSSVTGPVIAGVVAKPETPNPGQLAFSQDWTFKPAVTNVFDTSFALATVQTGGVSVGDVELAVDIQEFETSFALAAEQTGGVPVGDVELAVDIQEDVQNEAELTDNVLQDEETQNFLGDIWSYVSQ